MMHRITVVTTSGSSEVPSIVISSPRSSPDVLTRSAAPGSPLPGLDVASDDSSGEGSRDKKPNKELPKRPEKVSNWRKRGLQRCPVPDSDYAGLDLSKVKRRDLPIRLVVDDPMPLGKYYGDPYADTKTAEFFNLGKHKSKSRSFTEASSASVLDAKVASGNNGGIRGSRDKGASTESWHVSFDQDSQGGGFDGRLVSFDQDSKGGGFDGSVSGTNGGFRGGPDQGFTTESWLVPFDEETSNWSGFDSSTQAKESLSKRTKESFARLIALEKKLLLAGSHHSGSSHDPSPDENPRDIAQSKGPVIRMKFQGEMMSVSERIAAKLKEGECSWI